MLYVYSLKQFFSSRCLLHELDYSSQKTWEFPKVKLGKAALKLPPFLIKNYTLCIIKGSTITVFCQIITWHIRNKYILICSKTISNLHSWEEKFTYLMSSFSYDFFLLSSSVICLIIGKYLHWIILAYNYQTCSPCLGG